MASAAAFTLDDSEETDFTAAPVSSVAPVEQLPVQSPLPPPALRPTSPTPTYALAPGLSTNLSLKMRDPPKAHVDRDLGVTTLAQVSTVLRENQQRIEDTEAQLQDLMRQHARLVAAGRLLEQQKVLDVLASGPELGYDSGRPVASLLVYRCCLRWGCFGGDAQAASVLDNLSGLLLEAADEDAIAARTTAAARAQRAQQQQQQQAGAAGGNGGESDGGGGEDEGAQVEQAAVAAATRELAYWLAVTSVLLALVDPHLPLTGALTRGSAGAADGAGHHPGGHGGIPTPLAVVAGDARASMARAASAAAAKVQELQKKMGNTFSGMQALGKNLLMRSRRGSAAAAGASGGGAAAMLPRLGSSGSEAVSEGGGGGGQQPERQSSGALEAAAGAGGGGGGGEALAEPHAAVPAAPPSASGASRSASPSFGGPEQQPLPLPPVPSAPHSAAATAGGAVAAASAHSPEAFRQQLDLVVQKTYVQMRDSLKRHVSAVLPGCVQQSAAPPSPLSPAPSLPLSPGEGGGEEAAAGGGMSGVAAAGSAGDQGGAGGSGTEDGIATGRTPDVSAGGAGSPSPSLQPWVDLIGVLSQHLALLREAHVPRILIRCLFKQTLTFVDVQLFNQLLLRPECCSTSNARYLVAGLQMLDDWITGMGTATTPAPAAPAPAPGPASGQARQPQPVPQAQAQGAEAAGAEALAEGQGHGQGHGQALAQVQGAGAVEGHGWVAAGEELAVLVDDLRHIRQASHFLILANKGALRLEDFTAMCPALNVQQLYRLATTFWDDSPLPPPQSPPRTSRLSSGDEASAPAAAAVASPATAAADGAEGATAAAEGGEAEAGVSCKDADGAAEVNEVNDVSEEAAPEAADLEAAAAAAVAAAAAAAAADEAGNAPAVAATAEEPPPAVLRNVSGEVLEEMKRRYAVANNGGLIVTFLLDEDSAPLIVQGGGNGSNGVARQLLQVINEPRLHEALREGLPAALRGEDCPPSAFAFMLEEEAIGRIGSAALAAGH